MINNFNNYIFEILRSMKIGKIKLKFVILIEIILELKVQCYSGIILFLGIQGIFNIVNGLDFKIFRRKYLPILYLS